MAHEIDPRIAAMTDAVIRMPKPRQELARLRDERADLLAHLRAAHDIIRRMGGTCRVCAGGA